MIGSNHRIFLGRWSNNNLLLRKQVLRFSLPLRLRRSGLLLLRHFFLRRFGFSLFLLQNRSPLSRLRLSSQSLLLRLLQSQPSRPLARPSLALTFLSLTLALFRLILSNSSHLLSHQSRSFLRHGKRIQLGHLRRVLQWIALESRPFGSLLLGPQSPLDLLALQQLGQIRVGQHRLGQIIAGLERRGLSPSAVKRIQLTQSGFRPDAESPHVTARCQSPQIQFLHVQQRNARDIPEGLADAIVAVVDDARARPHDAAAIPHLALARAETLAGADFLHVLPGLDLTEESDGFFGLLKTLDLVVDDQRHLGNLFDLVSLGHDQSGYSSSGDGRAHGVSLLVGVDAMVPSTPRLGRGKHASTTAHVTEGTLTGSVSATPTHSGDPRHGSSGSPGGRRRLFAGTDVDAVRLPRIFQHFVMNKRNDVGTDGGFEDGREVHAFVSDGGSICAVDGDDRTRRHFFYSYLISFFISFFLNCLVK